MRFPLNGQVICKRCAQCLRKTGKTSRPCALAGKMIEKKFEMNLTMASCYTVHGIESLALQTVKQLFLGIVSVIRFFVIATKKNVALRSKHKAIVDSQYYL